MRGLNIRHFGENAVMIDWPEESGEVILQEILACEQFLRSRFKNDLIETVISYRAVVAYFKTNKKSAEIIDVLQRELTFNSVSLTETAIRIVPVCYDNEFGPDLDFLAAQCELSTSEVIELHTKPVYTVRFIGFLPGFPYLSRLDERLHTPRKSTPRRTVAAGSVAIGGAQTGIYTMDSPGGWHVLGRSPLEFFSPQNSPPSLFRPGDRLKFKAVSEEEYLQIEKELRTGKYNLEHIEND